MLAGPSPEVLIGPIAAATGAIRVGSGGVMLPHYSPLKVAESFSLLAGLFPGPHRPRDRARARHRPADHVRAPARPPPGRARRLPAAARRAARLPRGPAAARPPVRRASRASLPGRPYAPEPWLLGSSPQSALWAAELGLPYAFADFINPARRSDRRELPRAVRRLGAAGRRPQLAVAVWALCAEQREEAEYLAASSRWAFVKLRRGELIAVPPPEEAQRELEAGERAGVARRAPAPRGARHRRAGARRARAGRRRVRRAAS